MLTFPVQKVRVSMKMEVGEFRISNRGELDEYAY